MSSYIGIDPGKSGGIALIANGEAMAYPMPKTEKDVMLLLGSYASRPITLAVIEKAQAMPRQGSVSGFHYGQGYGFLRGLLLGLGIPFDEVRPQKWQKALGCLSKGDKNITKAKAQQLFPKLTITHSIADALLIAYYAGQVREH